MATPTTAQNNTAKTSEDSGVSIDVLANDPKSSVLYSLSQTNPGSAVTTTTTSLGATISIVNGKLVYDGTNATAVQGLSEGETKVDTFTYTIKLANGTLSTASVSVTVTGANDGPVITSGPATAGLTETAGQTGAATLLTSGGSLAFKDVDLHDTHTTSVSLQSVLLGTGVKLPAETQAALQSALSSSVATDTTNGGAGSLNWNFNITDKLVDFLGAGEKATAVYQITVDDGHGGKATQSVTVTLTGTNDAPVITHASVNTGTGGRCERRWRA